MKNNLLQVDHDHHNHHHISHLKVANPFSKGTALSIEFVEPLKYNSSKPVGDVDNSAYTDPI